ncbi:hypothetical protein L2E82_02774 [Cichorium intybus]|uniref:Uncharacterized protein n=1 Tax=Cichorium intybus TaxID=13427 RepID=A0ACB9H376_CICIN|nr:hypothetical protein L2E82_02774 [Cichorium intybus]
MAVGNLSFIATRLAPWDPQSINHSQIIRRYNTILPLSVYPDFKLRGRPQKSKKKGPGITTVQPPLTYPATVGLLTSPIPRLFAFARTTIISSNSPKNLNHPFFF